MISEEPKTKRKYKKSTIIKVGEDKPKAKKERHYVDNKAFYAAMQARRILYNQWKESGEIGPKPRISNEIGICIMQIAENLAKKYQFANYKFKDEMIHNAIEHCLKYIDSFNPEVSNNPFSYYTQTCYYSFLNTISSEKVQQYVKYKSTLSSAALGEVAEMVENMSNEAEHSFDNIMFDTDFMEKFVNDFENKMNIPKVPKVRKKRGLELLEDENLGEDK